MPKFLKWIAGPIAFALAFFAFRYATQSAPDDKPGLIGTMRVEFVQAAMQSCMKAQSDAPENKGLSASLLYQYCTCSVNVMADGLSTAEVKSVYAAADQKTALAAKLPRFESAFQRCIEASTKANAR